MTTKDKALPYIDAQSNAKVESPNVRKVKFNPYTGGVISTKSDTPTFGKYTMEIRSGTVFKSCEVEFTKTASSKIKTQIPIPQVKLTVKNPNYEIVDALVYLAFSEDALRGVDNGGNFDQIGRTVGLNDRYISFSPMAGSPIIKRTVTIDVYEQIVRLFEKYTIYEFLELTTGESYTGITDNNILIQALQDNLRNLELYAEAGFNNDSDSVLDGYFIRSKIVTRFSFDRAYLDNPSLSGFTFTTDKDSIDIRLKCSGLRKVRFSVYASSTNSFDYANDAPIKRYDFNVTLLNNPNLSIPLAELSGDIFTQINEFKTEAELNQIINSRKYIAVRITSVILSAGIEKEASDFSEFFRINPDTDTTKVQTLVYNIPAPTLATFVQPIIFPKPPYFVNLNNNTRKFFFRIQVNNPGPLGDGRSPPSGLSGFLIKYINNSTTASNTLRYFSFDNPLVNLETPAFIPKGANYAWYYYSITDFFKLNSSTNKPFNLDVPSATRVEVYLVDKYYYTSNTPVKLPNVSQINLVNYLNSFLKFSAITQIKFDFAVFQSLPRLSLSFIIKYTKVKVATETSPPSGAVYKTYGGDNPIVFVVENPQNYGTTIDYTARVGRVYLKGSSAPLAFINVADLWAGASDGQGYWFRFELYSNYSTDKALPYTGTVLGVVKVIKPKTKEN
jgi:hypothetical protein